MLNLTKMAAKKAVAAGLFAFCLSFQMIGQPISFEKYYGSPSISEEALVIDDLADGGFIVAGRSGSLQADDQVFVSKIDAAGEVTWTFFFGDNGLNDFPTSISVASDGSIFIGWLSAIQKTGVAERAFLTKTDAAGLKIWEQSYSTSGQYSAIVCKATTDGASAIALNELNLLGEPTAKVIKLLADGQSDFQQTEIGGQPIERVYDLDEHGGKLLAAGENSDGPFLATLSVGAVPIIWPEPRDKSFSPITPCGIAVRKTDGAVAVLGYVFAQPSICFYENANTISWSERLQDFGSISFRSNHVEFLADGKIMSFYERGLEVTSDFDGSKVIFKNVPTTPPQTSFFGYSMAVSSAGKIAVVGRATLADSGVDAGITFSDDQLTSFSAKNWGTPGPSDTETAAQIAQTNDGGYFFGGTRFFASAGSDFWIVRTDKFGEQLWEKNYGFAGNETLRGVVATTDGGAVISGYSRTAALPSVQSLLVVRIDENGQKVWEKNFDFKPNSTINDIAATKDGGFILTSNGTLGTPPAAPILVRLNAQGDTVWTKKFSDLSSQVSIREIIETKDGGFAGSGGIFGSLSSMWMTRFDNTGKLLWEKLYIDGLAMGYGVAELLDESLVFAGAAGTGDVPRDSVVLSRFQKDGTFMWRKYIADGISQHVWTVVHADASDNLTLTSSCNPVGPDSLQIAKLDANGAMIWEKKFSPASNVLSSNSIRSVDGGLAILAQGSPKNSRDLILIKALPDGSVGAPVSIKKAEKIALSPLPSSGPMHIDFSSAQKGMADLQLFDMAGRLVFEAQKMKSSERLEADFDFSDFAAGLYFLQIRLDGKAIGSAEWLKN